MSSEKLKLCSLSGNKLLTFVSLCIIINRKYDQKELPMKLELVATCLFGLEKLLGEEIDELGYERVSTIDGRVTFLGDPLNSISKLG